jgi:protein TonB
MHLLRNCTVLFSLSTAGAMIARSQNATPAAGAPVASGPAAGTPAAGTFAAPYAGSTPVDLSGFKVAIEQKNKALADEVSAEKAMVKKNTAILGDAKRIDAENKRLAMAREQLNAENAAFERERAAIQAEQGGGPAAAQAQGQRQLQQLLQPAPVPEAAPVATPSSRREPVPVAAAASMAATETTPAQALPVPVAPAPVAPVVVPVQIAPQSAKVSAPRFGDGYQPAGAETPPRTVSNGQAPLTETASVANDGVIVVKAKEEGPLRVSSGVLQGMLLSPIRPVYPQSARQAHVEGTVVLDAVISKTGAVEAVHAISGPAALREAAIEAIQTARYQPYRLGEEAVEIETTVTIAFEQTR